MFSFGTSFERLETTEDWTDIDTLPGLVWKSVRFSLWDDIAQIPRIVQDMGWIPIWAGPSNCKHDKLHSSLSIGNYWS